MSDLEEMYFAAVSRAESAEATLERVRALHEFDDGYCKSCSIPFHECEVAMELAAPVTEEGNGDGL